ncbi:hypothetical protein WA026_017059 [Henosepilachna vigintioctopunctata]|uniref:Uncharacterized protein n=1 Tax=Henosepilachna vigintioctopunctata TaxID=420089 RepID=A0AAW1TPM7_9CUCU
MNSRKKETEYLNQLENMNEEDSETTGGEDDEMKAVDDMIIKASRELEQVVEDNQELLEKLDKSRYHSDKQNPIFRGGGEQNSNIIHNDVLKQLEEAEGQAKATANIIYKLKTRVGELLKKDELTEEETKELDLKNKQLKESMKSLEENTIKIQNLIEKTNIINNKDLKEVRCFLNSPRAIFNTSEEKTVFKIPTYNTNKKVDVVSGRCSCCSENIRQIPQNVPTFAKKLCQSYSMQEKLAAENASLESIRFKLQEELLNKDQSLECLERELSNLQNEMKLISKENNVLNEKLQILQRKEESTINQNHKNSSSCEFRIKEYSDNIYQLEKQLTDMESDVKYLQGEICAVQSEREHLEKHRKMMCKTRPCVPPYPRHSFRGMDGFSFSKGSQLQPGQVSEQFNEKYNVLNKNVKIKLNEIVALKTDYERLRNLTNEAEELKTITENNTKDCEILMNALKAENKITAEQEHQLSVAKNRLRRAQESLKEHKMLITDQKKQLEDVANRCLEVQQKLEDHKNRKHSQVHVSDGDGFNTGIHIISNLQDKLGEIAI